MNSPLLYTLSQIKPLHTLPSYFFKINVNILTFRGPRIMIYSYNKTNDMHFFLKFVFGIELYMFWNVSLSIIRSLALYTQQQVYVIQIMLTAC